MLFPIMEHPKKHEPTDEEWRELARQATKEEDPQKLVALAEQIVQAFDAEKRKGPRRASASN
jgi:hypothetical protein